MLINIFFISILSFLSLFFLLRKFNVLIDDKDISFHKKLTFFSGKPILIGGIYIFLLTIISFPESYLYFKILILLMLFAGLISDLNFLNSPLIRFIIQLILILLLVIIENVYIRSLSADILNLLLSNNIFNIFMTISCFLVLVNGTNFLDGLNGLVSGYFIISISCIYFLGNYELINLIYEKEILYLLIGLTIFFIFNLFGLTFLGDSGAYILSLVVGFIFLENFNSNISISPYFIALLLWYPAFENLFSLSRRMIFNKKISNPDNLHLHQLIFLKVKYKLNNDKFSNTISSLIILVYNLSIFVIASNFHNSTKLMLSLILINIIIYLFLYYFFSKNLINKK